jgi:Domain of unknown function (DUF4386)
MNTNAMSERTAEMSPLFKARVAGSFWLITFLTGSFAMFVGGKVMVSGDAAATVANILAHESSVRLGGVANLIATACYLTATLFVYELLKAVNRTLSLLAAFFSLIGCAIGAVGFLFYLAPLRILGGGPYLNVFSPEQLQAHAFTFLRLSGQANDLGLVFFGLHILLVGYLILRSTFLPRILGALLTVGGLCYMTSSFADFLSFPFRTHLFPYILLPAFVAELLLCLWFLVKGVNVQRWNEQAGSAAAI